MIKAVHRYAKRKGLTINAEKSKIVQFSKGSRGSNTDWNIEGTHYEEVSSIKYLGVRLQRNGKYTEHNKEVALKAKKRASEVWSLGERLFPNNFQVRKKMFNSLVTPIMTYASEVTGYSECMDLDKVQRRFFRWTLGLPLGTRISILETETELITINQQRLISASRYENNMQSKCSLLLKKVFNDSRRMDLTDEERERAVNKMGWSAKEFDRLLRTREGFWREVKQRACDVAKQVRRADVRSTTWYIAQEDGLPGYLREPNGDMKLIARFRCGAMSRGTQSWRGDGGLCRLCGIEKEMPSHQVKCGSNQETEINTMEHLLDPGGKGVGIMKEVANRYNEL